MNPNEQHIVPRGYLRQFGIEGNTEFVYRLKIKSPYPNPKIIDVSVGSICYVHDYYTIETDFLLERYNIENPYFLEEKGFPYEKKFSIYFSKLLDLKALNTVEATEFTEMLLNMKMRNLAMLRPFEDQEIVNKSLEGQYQSLRKSASKYALRFQALGIDLEEVVKQCEERTTEMFSDSRHRKDLYREILLEQVFDKKRNQRLVNMLLTKKFFVFKTDKAYPFVTNDNPGATLTRNERIVNTNFSNWYAFSFPINPEYLFMIINEDDWSGFNANRMKIIHSREVDQRFVDFANKACIHNCNDMIIASSKPVLEKLKMQYHHFYLRPRK